MSRPRESKEESIKRIISSNSGVIDFITNPENHLQTQLAPNHGCSALNVMAQPAAPSIHNGLGVYGGPPAYLETNGIRYIPAPTPLSTQVSLKPNHIPLQSQGGADSLLPPMSHMEKGMIPRAEHTVDLDSRINQFLYTDNKKAPGGGLGAKHGGVSRSDYHSMLQAQLDTERSLAQVRANADMERAQSRLKEKSRYSDDKYSGGGRERLGANYSKTQSAYAEEHDHDLVPSDHEEEQQQQLPVKTQKNSKYW